MDLFKFDFKVDMLVLQTLIPTWQQDFSHYVFCGLMCAALHLGGKNKTQISNSNSNNCFYYKSIQENNPTSKGSRLYFTECFGSDRKVKCYYKYRSQSYNLIHMRGPRTLAQKATQVNKQCMEAGVS